MAMPKSLSTRSSPAANEAKTDDHHRGGRRDDAAGVGQPFAHRCARVAAVLPLLVDAGDEEDLVVHREPEHDREDHHGDEGVDRSGLDAEEAAEPAALEDRLDDTERQRRSRAGS